MKLNVKSFALTVGIIWGLCIFLGTWWIIVWDGSSADMTWLGQMYRGYTVTPLGCLIGLVWGFVDGFIVGMVFAWLYNLILPKEKKKKTTSKSKKKK